MTMMNRISRTLGVALILTTLTLSSCADMSATQQRAMTGTAMGAAGGAAIGAMAGNAPMGAAIGAGVGLLGGLIVDRQEKAKESAYEQGRRDAQAEQ
jgi:hypothetical protein